MSQNVHINQWTTISYSESISTIVHVTDGQNIGLAMWRTIRRTTETSASGWPARLESWQTANGWKRFKQRFDTCRLRWGFTCVYNDCFLIPLSMSKREAGLREWILLVYAHLHSWYLCNLMNSFSKMHQNASCSLWSADRNAAWNADLRGSAGSSRGALAFSRRLGAAWWKWFQVGGHFEV